MNEFFCRTMLNGLLVSYYILALTVCTALIVSLVHSLHTVLVLRFAGHGNVRQFLLQNCENLLKVKNSSQRIFSVTCQPTVGRQAANIQLNGTYMFQTEVLANFMIDQLVYCLANVTGCKKGVKLHVYVAKVKIE